MVKRRRERMSHGFLINPHLQWSVIGRVLIVASVNFGLVLGASEYIFRHFQAYAMAQGVQPDSNYLLLLEAEHWLMTITFAAIGAVCFAVTIFGGILLSHRVAGPIHQLTNHLLQDNRDLVYRPLEFRRKDYFPELREAYNNHIQLLQEKKLHPSGVERRKGRAS